MPKLSHSSVPALQLVCHILLPYITQKKKSCLSILALRDIALDSIKDITRILEDVTRTPSGVTKIAFPIRRRFARHVAFCNSMLSATLHYPSQAEWEPHRCPRSHAWLVQPRLLEGSELLLSCSPSLTLRWAAVLISAALHRG